MHILCIFSVALTDVRGDAEYNVMKEWFYAWPSWKYWHIRRKWYTYNSQKCVHRGA